MITYIQQGVYGVAVMFSIYVIYTVLAILWG